MRLFYLSILGFLFPTLLLAQLTTERAVATLSWHSNVNTMSLEGVLPLTPAEPFFSYFVKWDNPAVTQFDIRFSADGENWGSWTPLQQDTHNPKDQISELHFGSSAARYYQLRHDDVIYGTTTLELHCYNPGETPPKASTYSPPTYTKACPCPLPAVEGRNDWCSTANCPPHSSPSTTAVSHLIVHHAAGTNESDDWAGVVRGIWDFHVNGNGWADVGYNYLIDPNGVVYEGRGDNITGAHFCGNNSNTMGVCMLGNYQTITPTSDAVDALERLLAWKSCDIDEDPLGQSFHNSSGTVLKTISGHRDGCATSCPGDSFYPMLPDVRQGVADLILSECAGLPSPTNLAAIELTPTSYFFTWSHNANDEEGFLLERSLDNGTNYELRTTLPANTLSFIEDDLEVEQIYLYRIRAISAIDTSDYSNVLTINTGVVNSNSPSLPPSALRISPNPTKSMTQVTLSGPWRGELTWQLLDLHQRVLQTANSEKRTDQWTQELDLSTLPEGNYLLQIRIGSSWGTWQVLKQ
ncbi:MAG: N-acetylmuramoyl-L-alanine amidase [Bacteroidota bacterium]